MSLSLWIAVIAVIAAVAAGALVAAMARRSSANIVTSRFGRLARVAWGSTRMLFRWLVRRLTRLLRGKRSREEHDRRHRAESARLVAETMGNMKGVMMKLGQIVSFMDEVMPPEVQAHLRTLQRNAPAMSYDTVCDVITGELGHAPERLFAELDPKPVASASIGQVHRALLRDGSEVAVKVQYPGVDAAIAADLDNFGFLMATIGAVTPTLDAKPLAQELRERVLEELDYEKEAANQQRFYELFAGYPDIRVPRVFPELSSKRVLVSEYVRGLGFYDFVDSADAEAKRRAVLAIRAFVFDSIWEHNLFNGDPHPGNYVFQPSGEVTFLDFGCVKHFDPEFIDNFRALNRAYLDGERETYYDIAKRMNFIIEGQESKVSHEWLWNFTRWFYLPLLVDRPFALDADYCRKSVSTIFGDNMRKVNMPAEYLMFNRITFGFNSIMAKLDACENWRRLSWRYYYREDHPD